MKDDKSCRLQSTKFHQQLPPENPEGALARQNQQYQPAGKNTTDPSRTGNGKKEIGMDRTHAEEASG